MFCASVSKLGLVVTSVLAMACLASSRQPLTFSSSCCSLLSLSSSLLAFGTEAMVISRACHRKHQTRTRIICMEAFTLNEKYGRPSCLPRWKKDLTSSMFEPSL